MFIEDDGKHILINLSGLCNRFACAGSRANKSSLIGRFQTASNMTEEALRMIILSKRIEEIPVIANVNFGHTHPAATIPVGAKAEVVASRKTTNIVIWQNG